MTIHTPIPVKAALELAQKYNKHAVVIIGRDTHSGMFHTTTYGATAEDKLWAAEAGERCTTVCGGMLELKHSFEDFRTVDAAKRTVKIDALARSAKAASHTLKSIKAVREGMTDEAIDNVITALDEALAISEQS